MKHAINRMIDKIGRPLTHVYYTQDGEDNYGEVWEPNTETIPGRINRSGTVMQQRSEHSASVDVDASIYVKADDAQNVSDGGGDGASEFEIDGRTYVVLQKDNQDTGLVRLDCDRER